MADDRVGETAGGAVTRRKAIVIVAAAGVASFAGRDKWITVADGQLTGNGYRYSAEALQDMQKQLLSGTRVHSWPIEPGTDPSMETLSGMVSKSRLIGGLVQVQIAWLKGRKPMERSFACPWGNGFLANGFIERYTIDWLVVTSGGSSIKGATPV